MKKVIQKIGVITAVLFSFSPTSVSAYDFTVGGIFYNITSMADLEVEVTYEKLSNYSNASSYSGHITIPSTVNYDNRTYTVTGIGTAAFGSKTGKSGSGYYNYYYYSSSGKPTAITSISLPQTVKSIGSCAFENCKIDSIQLPSSLTVIGMGAFAGSSLKNVVLPDSVSIIGEGAFYESSIRRVVFGKNIQTIGKSAFQYCSSLMEAFFTSKKCPTLGAYAFSGAHSALERYVPSESTYGFGKEYVTLPTHEFDYTGQPHAIEWTNNLKAYKCEIAASECQTEVNAGTYTKYLTGTYSNGVDCSVDIPYEYTINKAPMALAVNDVSREYGEENPAFTCSYSGFVDGESEQTLGASPVYDCEATKSSKVGNYRILVSLDAPNYEVTYKYGNLSIQKASLVASVNSVSKVYGDKNPEFSLAYSGLKNGESSPEWTTKPTFTTLANASSSAGEYAVNADGGESVNYEVSKYNSGILTVTKAPLTVSVINTSKVYGDENPDFSLSYSGLKNNEGSPEWTTKPTFTTSANASSGVGEYAVNATGGVAVNYEVSKYTPGTLTIKKAPLTVSVNNASKVYGDENPEFSLSYSGLKNNESSPEWTTMPTFTTSAKISSGVGGYVVNASKGVATNYDVSKYTPGTLTIKKAPLTVSVNNASKVYGDENPDFSLSYSGLKNGESVPVWMVNPTFITSAKASSGVGEYEVNATNGVAANYDISKCNPGILTVEKRNLTAKANDYERQYNEENPTFEISYTGFANGDTEANFAKKPVAECSATKSSDAGTYPIVVSGGEAANYKFVCQDGVLKINPLTVGFKDEYISVTYNDTALSTNNRYFNYIPEIVGPFSEDDFELELWFLDKENNYDQHVATIRNGEYSGNYVKTNLDSCMWAGKYIFNLVHKGSNPNVTANPSRAYLTVGQASNNLVWNPDSAIIINVGETVDLGISYQADLWCDFNRSYDKEIITLSSENEKGKNPHWHATGLKEGETTLYFGIECKKNDRGFFDFGGSKMLSQLIKVVADKDGIDGVYNDAPKISVKAINGNLVVFGKKENTLVRVFNLQGSLMAETFANEIFNLSPGLYVVTVGNKTIKVLL